MDRDGDARRLSSTTKEDDNKRRLGFVERQRGCEGIKKNEKRDIQGRNEKEENNRD